MTTFKHDGGGLADPRAVAAFGWARAGRPVFPLDGKRPLVKWQDAATTDPARVRALWRKHPGANVGIPTGARSGVVVLDVDGDDGRASLAALERQYGRLPKTYRVRSGRGEHIYFRAVDGLRNRAAARPGLDVRGEGGLVVAAGSVHANGDTYNAVDECAAVAAAPDWLLAALERPTSTEASTTRSIGVEPSVYAAAAMASELGELAQAEAGSRNDRLNAAAFALGHLVGAGHLDEVTARAGLLRVALQIGLAEAEAQATIQSGLTKGKQEPAALVRSGDEDAPDDQQAEIAKRVTKLWVEERAKRQFRAEIVAERNAKSRGSRQMDGAEFVLDLPPTVPVLWGDGLEALWVAGEAVLLAGGDGIGKTTLAQQLVFRRLGVKDHLLDYPVEPAAGRVLYLAMDRPDQARRSFARMLPKEYREEHRSLLKERLCVWRGPVPVDVLSASDTLANWVHETYGSDVTDVFVDSYKDLAPGLSDDAVGAGLNSAMQEVLARGMNWLGIHHQRKASGSNPDPTELADVYGSRWLTAGVGSLLMLVGRAGDRTVEIRHLKQPASVVGPLLVQHDHVNGATRLVDTTGEPFDVLDAAGVEGVTVYDFALAMFQSGDEAAKKRAGRLLNRLVAKGDAVMKAAKRGGAGGSEPARYWLKKHVPAGV